MPQRRDERPARRRGVFVGVALFSFCMLFSGCLSLTVIPSEQPQPGPVRLLYTVQRVRVYCIAADDSLWEASLHEPTAGQRRSVALPVDPSPHPPSPALRGAACAAPIRPAALRTRFGFRHAGRAPPVPSALISIG